MRRYGFLIWVCVWLASVPVMAQYAGSGSSVFNFLDLPASSRINALGGSNVSVRDGDVSMAMCNPALLGERTDKVLQMNFSYYLPGTMFGSVLYGHNFKDIQSLSKDSISKPNYFAVGVHYLDYGHMPYADEEGNLSGGTFGAKDILIDAIYARQLSEYFTIGVAIKPIYSVYESYHSFAIGADVGGHFQTKDSTFQMGLVLRNIGWQVKGFYSDEDGTAHEILPLNLELGLNYRFAHAPIRLHMTLHNLQRWNLGYEWNSLDKDPTTGDIVQHDIKWYDMLFRHTIFAIDIVPKSERFYLTLSYNHRRRAELNLTDQKSLAGFGLGAGVRIKQARIGFAVSQLTRNNFSYQAGLSLDINSLLK